MNEYLTLDPDGGGTGFQPVAFTNDAAGNLTVNPLARNIGDGSGGIPSPSGQTYEYDEENRLKAVKRGSDLATLLSMKYDALGRRVESTDHTAASDPCDGTYQPVRTRHVAAGIETLAEFIECSTGWVKAREFVWGAAFPEPLAMIDWTEAGATASGTAEALHYVHKYLGSPAALTNASREAVERYTYDPYGRTTIENAAGTRLAASAFGNPFAWTGQRYDAGVKLYHFLFRSYSPELGRWMQRDPAEYVDGVSLYQGMKSAPHRLIDPLGCDVWLAEVGFHMKVCVGDPLGEYFCYTFWKDTPWWWGWGDTGVVDEDNPGGKIVPGHYKRTSREQDQVTMRQLEDMLGSRSHYCVANNCRTFSRMVWKYIVLAGTDSAPPPGYNPNPGNTPRGSSCFSGSGSSSDSSSDGSTSSSESSSSSVN